MFTCEFDFLVHSTPFYYGRKEKQFGRLLKIFFILTKMQNRKNPWGKWTAENYQLSFYVNLGKKIMYIFHLIKANIVDEFERRLGLLKPAIILTKHPFIPLPLFISQHENMSSKMFSCVCIALLAFGYLSFQFDPVQGQSCGGAGCKFLSEKSQK